MTEVLPISEELVELRLVMPSFLVRAFSECVSALFSLFERAKSLERRERAALKARDPEEKARRKARAERGKRLVIEAYKKALSKGLEPREAISEANRALKAQGEKWACHYLVTEIVRKAGLLRGTNYYKRGRENG